MSSPLAGSRVVAFNPLRHTPSPVPRQNQSLSTAEGFSEIRVETPSPQSIQMPETLNVATTAPTHSFADRHPTMTRALATCAASIACLASITSSLPLYLLTAPVRVFATALSLISPKQGASFSKSAAFQTLIGEMGDVINILAIERNRKHLAIIGALDICSLGISVSALSAISTGETAFQHTRSAVTNILSNTKQRRLAEQSQQQALEAQNRGIADQREDQLAQVRISQAETLSQHISRILPEHNEINVAQWVHFETIHNIDTKPLSALLEKLLKGMKLAQSNLSSSFPATPTPQEKLQQEKQIDNIQKSLMKRIGDVLIKCQDSPEITQQVCKIAEERGLASCTDRSATAWLAIEEFIDTSHIANHIQKLTQELGMPNSQDTLIQQAIHQLLTFEHKKHRFEQLKSHLDKDRDALTRGLGSIDYIELLLDVYNLIQQANPTAFRELPYQNFHSHLAKKTLVKEANQIINRLEHPEKPQSWKMALSKLSELKQAFSKNKALIQKTAKIDSFSHYLQTSDAWTSVFQALHSNSSSNAKQIADHLEASMNTLFGLPLSEGEKTNLLNLFDGFRRLHTAQKPTLEQEQSILNKDSILSHAETQLNAIVQANTPRMATAKTLLNQIQNLSEDFFDALEAAAMAQEPSTESNIELLTSFLEQVHLFLQNTREKGFSKASEKKILENMTLDLGKTEFTPARTALKQAYLSTHSEAASDILNAFNLLTQPDKTGLEKFTKEHILKTFPEPITLRKIGNTA